MEEKKERKMRDSGIPWIGEVPEGWEFSKIKYHCTMKSGDNITALDISDNGEYPVYGGNGLRGFYKIYNKNGNHILIGRQGALAGNVHLVNGKFWATDHAVIVTLKNDVFINYFFRMLESMNLNQYAFDTAAQPGLSVSRIMNLNIVLPNLKEQHRIADFLGSKCSEIDTLIEHLRARMESAKEYKKAVITEAVTKGLDKNIDLKETDSFFWHNIPKHWDFADIKYVFEIVKRIAGKEGYDVLSVTQKGLKVKDITCNEGQIAANYKGYQFVYPDDFVMNHMDLLTGWVDCSKMFGVTSPDYRVFRLQDKNKHDLRYYTYIMQCCYTNRYFYSLGQGVSTLGRWRLQTSSFMNFQIPVPPKEEQRRIADYLDSKCSEIDALLQNYEDQITTLEEYKKSLIYQA
jgi:type I restriction enzyme S subunit